MSQKKYIVRLSTEEREELHNTESSISGVRAPSRYVEHMWFWRRMSMVLTHGQMRRSATAMGCLRVQ